MSEAAARFVRALAALVSRDGDATARAAEARAALDEVFAAQKSLVLDVQFTGFSQKGQLVGGVDPRVLRAAGHLITLRLNRVGFTPEVSVADLEAFGAVVSRPAGELGQGGAIGALAEAHPRGLYASTGAGEVYKPARAAAPSASSEPAAPPVEGAAEAAAPPAADAPAAAPAAEAVPSAAEAAAPPVAAAPGMAWDEVVESTELAEFEFIDAVDLPEPPAAGEPAEMSGASSYARAGEPAAREEPHSSDMYHFFRTADHSEAQAEALPRLLHQASTVTRFDELAESAARTALALLKADEHEAAVELLDAL
ncbi:MAG TPA: hypothetical protein VGX50_02885, partial [Longimicrobium sp.]|nr:hypothetical protein [Longimicrobium sp.]